MKWFLIHVGNDYAAAAAAADDDDDDVGDDDDDERDVEEKVHYGYEARRS